MSFTSLCRKEDYPVLSLPYLAMTFLPILSTVLKVKLVNKGFTGQTIPSYTSSRPSTISSSLF